ncbi:hypothetical protein AKJ61_03660 [candidate division MSBL1 archaeon SCGC-AAA259B11]|uniref:Uncharacterized protein n=1 Tax=candidate division MSBL1 archaeon SCGC-AAA259B11 TaxID=1698260 RepID=A0A133U4E6_9EURY|nr:hypothetical protein AKJ61_03660 [candidate division MSBL1 archaeon SCGC-AAA259B11]
MTASVRAGGCEATRRDPGKAKGDGTPWTGGQKKNEELLIVDVEPSASVVPALSTRYFFFGRSKG